MCPLCVRCLCFWAGLGDYKFARTPASTREALRPEGCSEVAPSVGGLEVAALGCKLKATFRQAHFTGLTEITLSRSKFQLLESLMRRSVRVVSRDALGDYESQDVRGLGYIQRRLLARSYQENSPTFIEPVPRHYRLNCVSFGQDAGASSMIVRKNGATGEAATLLYDDLRGFGPH